MRPREWYNLAKRHGGWQFLLHDDFYDEDGTACQPKYDVESSELFPVPTLSEVAADPEALLDYTITRWSFDDTLAAAWRKLPSASVLSAVARRFSATRSSDLHHVTLEVASTVGVPAEHFVRYAWREYPESVHLGSLAKASAACLPLHEGFDRTIEALSRLDDVQKRDQMHGLSYFRFRESLDWIEVNIFDPVNEPWGYLAAASDLDWSRIAAWLQRGRPLSLAALDAMLAIIRPQSPLLREMAPLLRCPPDADTLHRTLTAYTERDPVPRVMMSVQNILRHAETLLGSPRPS